jgi:hypothetical protein
MLSDLLPDEDANSKTCELKLLTKKPLTEIAAAVAVAAAVAGNH